MLHPDDKDIIERAIKLASLVHKDDKWGEFPYMLHLALAAVEVRAIDPDRPLLEAAAWLHDVVEDHPEYEDQVKREFPKVYEIVKIVSRVEGETYDEFIQRVIDSYNDGAIILKLADMRVNLGNNPRESLVKRYEKHLPVLERRVSSMWQ